MTFEKFNLEELTTARRNALANSLRTVSYDELKKLGDEIFIHADDPWRQTFFDFIANNRAATFHYAETSDGVHIVYCRDRDIGMWFVPGTGKGPLQSRGRQTMKEIIENRR